MFPGLKMMLVGLFVGGAIMAKANLDPYFKTLSDLSKQQELKADEWKNFVNQVDKDCDKNSSFCEFYYMLESSMILFDEDEYKDGGQCERAKVNVETYFANQFPTQKNQVLSIVEKICKTQK